MLPSTLARRFTFSMALFPGKVWDIPVGIRHPRKPTRLLSNAYFGLKSMQKLEHSPMNLRSLRTFVATAEFGGLGRASARLNLSQPAASRQIHALEAEFGVPLFQRVG